MWRLSAIRCLALLDNMPCHEVALRTERFRGANKKYLNAKIGFNRPRRCASPNHRRFARPGSRSGFKRSVVADGF